MDKSLSQEEIDALFNQSSDINNVETSEQVNVDEKEYTTTNETIESLLDYKYNENAKMIQDLFDANNNSNNEQINSEDVAYQNSPFYPMYLNIVGNIKNILAPAIMQMENEYRFMESRNFLSDSVLKRMGKEILLPNFILAKVKYDEFMNIVTDAVEELKTIDNIDYEVLIKRLNYIPLDNGSKVLKQVDGFKIIINIKRHEKIK